MKNNFNYWMIKMRTVVVFGLALWGLYMTSHISYILFHSLAEFFSITIGFTAFVITWNTRHQLDNNYMIWLGISLLFVTSLDLIHTLAYKGMGVFTGYDANLPTQLWIASRYLQSLSMLAAALFFQRKLNPVAIIWISLIISAGLVISIFTGVFPACYVEGSGLTDFKIVSEYIIIAIMLTGNFILWRQRQAFDSEVLGWLMTSQFLTICAEVAFTSYVSVYGPANMIGHFLKLIAFYFVYKAIVKMGLERPHRVLFRNLKQSETALRNALEEVQKLAIIDALTGLYNRRHFFELAEFEFQRAHRYQRELSVIMLDIDDFKMVNDTYGHIIGDQVLQEIAESCRQETRKVDIVARYGGEEFIFLLPEIDIETAMQVAERLRENIATRKITTRAGSVTVTASLGLSNLTEDYPNLESLLIAADAALYQAKETGRNRIFWQKPLHKTAA